MARNTTVLPVSPEKVFEVLIDPYAYPRWVVGARAIRAVDPEWPAVGTSFHHRLARASGGIADKTTILALDGPRELVLKAYARPFGIAKVAFTLEPHAEGSRLTLHEVPLRPVHLKAAQRFIDPLIHLRNMESLRRLRKLLDSSA